MHPSIPCCRQNSHLTTKNDSVPSVEYSIDCDSTRREQMNTLMVSSDSEGKAFGQNTPTVLTVTNSDQSKSDSDEEHHQSYSITVKCTKCCSYFSLREIAQ